MGNRAPKGKLWSREATLVVLCALLQMVIPVTGGLRVVIWIAACGLAVHAVWGLNGLPHRGRPWIAAGAVASLVLLAWFTRPVANLDTEKIMNALSKTTADIQDVKKSLDALGGAAKLETMLQAKYRFGYVVVNMDRIHSSIPIQTRLRDFTFDATGIAYQENEDGTFIVGLPDISDRRRGGLTTSRGSTYGGPRRAGWSAHAFRLSDVQVWVEVLAVQPTGTTIVIGFSPITP